MESAEAARLNFLRPPLRDLANEMAPFAEPRLPTARTAAPIEFQVIDSTYRVLNAHPADDIGRKSEAFVRLYGRTSDGLSICLDVRGFSPYMYVRATEPAALEQLRRDPEGALAVAASLVRGVMDRCAGFLRGIELEDNIHMYEYHTERGPCLKITLSNPRDIAVLRDIILEEGTLATFGTEVYECNIPFCTRFAIDTGMRAAGYVTVPPGTMRERTALPPDTRARMAKAVGDGELLMMRGRVAEAEARFQEVSRIEAMLAAEDAPQTYCQIEGVAHYADLEFHGDVGRPSVHPQMRRLYVDIEVGGVPQRFSQPIRPEDAVCSICLFLQTGASDRPTRVAMVVGDADLPPNADRMFCYPTERTLLMAWFVLLRVAAPDIVSGYNSTNYDMWYLFERARYLGLMEPSVCRACFDGQQFNMLGRERGHKGFMKLEEFESGAVGRLEYYVVDMPGIVEFDMFLAVRRDPMLRLRQYKLDFVAESLLSLNHAGLTYGSLAWVAEGCTAEEMKALAYGEGRIVRRLNKWNPDSGRFEPTPKGVGAVRAVCTLRGRPEEDLTLRSIPWVAAGVSDDTLRGYRCGDEGCGGETCHCARARAAVAKYCVLDAATGFWHRTPGGVAAVNRVANVTVGKSFMTYEALPFIAHGALARYLRAVEQFKPGDTDTRAIVEHYCQRTLVCCACGAPAEPRVCACEAPPEPFFAATPLSRKVMLEYCVMDAELAWRISVRRKYLENAAEVANLTCTNLSRQIKGGQSERIQAAIISRIRQDKVPFHFPFYRPPNLSKADKRRHAKGFKGAAVLDMKTEFIADRIAVGDYSALYPSIIIAFNLCYTTYVPQDRLASVIAANQAAHARDGVHMSPAGHWFLDADIREGILPRQLKLVLEARGAAKQQDAAEGAVVRKYRASAKWVEAADWRVVADAAGDEGLEAFRGKDPDAARAARDAFITKGLAEAAEAGREPSVHWTLKVTEHGALSAAYDAKQGALKVVANSMYGFTGAVIGKLPCTPVSESVTAYGRMMIMRIKEIAERRNPEKGLYCCDPESSTEEFRRGLTTHRTEVIYGDSVPGPTPVCVRNHRTGLLEIRRIDELAETAWTVDIVGKETSTCAYDAWTERGWTPIRKVIRHRVPASKAVWEVSTHVGCVRATDDHSLLTSDGAPVSSSDAQLGMSLLHAGLPAPQGARTRAQNGWWAVDAYGDVRVPDSILSGSTQVRRRFLAACCSECRGGRVLATVRGEIAAAGLFYVMSSLRLHVRLERSASEPDLFVVAGRRRPPMVSDYNVVRKRQVVHHGMTVYDLDTENHHFQAGAGCMVVHNTDSAFVRLHGCGDSAEAIAFNRKMCKMVTASFNNATVKLEAEKVLVFFLGFSPKKYCTLQCEETRGGELIHKINAKGFELVRRDTCEILQEVMQTCVNLVFPHGDRLGMEPDV